MAILSGELKLYRSLVVNDGSTNGGRLSANEMISGVVGNMFPSINDTERAAGSTKYRKVFAKVANDEDLTLFSPRLYMDVVTPGEDMITFFPATQTDTQAAVTGSERQYGAGVLDASAVATATGITVLVEEGAIPVFVVGDTIRISDKENLADEAGNEEFVEILTASVTLDVVSITFTPALEFSYADSVTRVSAVYEPPSDVVATVAGVTVTSTAGLLDEDNVLGGNVGGIEQVWTCLFTSPTAFNITGDTVGAVGSGTTGAGAAPNNASFGEPYFTMQAAGFTGTWVAGDTIVFTTHPAAVPLWFKRVVPAGAAALANNRARFVFAGESAA
jgi:hypothetical protein